jgi:hypothetical protein
LHKNKAINHAGAENRDAIGLSFASPVFDSIDFGAVAISEEMTVIQNPRLWQ